MIDLGLEVEEERTAALQLLASPGSNSSWLSIHLVVYNEELAIPEQTATGKGISNPLMAGSLPKTTKPTYEDLGKLKPKADIGIFIGYSPAKKAYRIYNRRTKLIMETIHVDFDELAVMDSEQFGSGPKLQIMTPGTISSGLMQNQSSSTPYPSPSVVSHVLPAVAPISVDTTGTPSSTTINQDAPSVKHSSQESSSNLHPPNPPFKHLSKWTKDHPLDNVTGNPSCPVSTRRQLQTDVMWCYFDAFLTSVKPKNYKDALLESLWIEAMQEDFHEFERLQV
ncbi:integrase, catalytic region, zinc finger, CCHC-type containing protein [Tanacetum coccineum]